MASHWVRTQIYRIAVSLESEVLRKEYLGQACNDDEALYDRVALLLNAHDEEPDFLESPPSGAWRLWTLLPSPNASARRSAPTSSSRRSAKAAWASSTWPCSRSRSAAEVALKVIKPGMDSKQVVARFEAERQALAMMDHPNIARVIDGGHHRIGPSLLRDGVGQGHPDHGLL